MAALAYFYKQNIVDNLKREFTLTELIAFAEGFKEHKPKPTSLSKLIINEVCCFYEITENELVSSYKKTHLSEARKIVSCLLYCFTKKTTSQIGFFTQKDHSTIVYHLKRMRELQTQNDKYYKDFEYLLEKISSEYCVNILRKL